MALLLLIVIDCLVDIRSELRANLAQHSIGLQGVHNEALQLLYILLIFLPS